MLGRTLLTLLRSLILFLVLALLLVVAGWVLLITTNKEIQLDGLRGPIQTATQLALRRPLRIEGPIVLKQSFFPTLEIQDVRLPNRSLQPGNMLEVDYLLVEINPIALFWLDAEVSRLEADGVRLRLLRDDDQRVNWNFSERDLAEQPVSTSEQFVPSPNLVLDMGVVSITDFSFSYSDVSSDLDFIVYFNSVDGTAFWTQSLSLEVDASVSGEPVSLTLEGDSMKTLLEYQKPWNGVSRVRFGELKLDVDIELAPYVVDRSEDKLRLNLSGQSLRDLKVLQDLDYPDWGPFNASGSLHMAGEQGYRIEETWVQIGDSYITGDVDIDLTPEIPRIWGQISGGSIQLRDFPYEEILEEAREDMAEGGDELATNFGADQYDLETLDLRFYGTAGSLYADKTYLGEAKVDVGLSQGVLSITDFELISPQGQLYADIGFRPRGPVLQSRMAIVARDYDYEPILAYLVDENPNQGTLDARIELMSESDDLLNVLKGASGEIAVTLWPTDYSTASLDNWASGLISTIFTRYGDNSVMNCVVARFDLEDGIATDKSVMLDTSGMRVFGEGTIDFKESEVDLYLIPKPKDRAFINLAIPVQMQGTFEDFGFGVRGDDVIKSYFRNFWRVWLVGIPLLFQETLDPDGSQICRLAMETDLDIKRPDEDLLDAQRIPAPLDQ